MAKRLFNRIADGDSQAFSEFYEGTSGGLYAYFLRVSRSVTTAIELLQTTYIRLWEERKYLVEVTHPMAYIRRIASREVSKYLIDKEADRKTIQLEDAETLLPPELPAFYELELKEVMHKIELAVRQLPPQQQMVFRLGKFEELSEKEIAVRMGLSVSSVNNYMQLAMKKVRKIVLNDY
jgi:RNA polymerase sigma-70 factor (ECF subfamily)